AQSCGVPVIVTRTGGAPEALVDEETGFVVRERDPEAMASAAARLLSDGPLRQRMAGAAAAYAADHFGLERMARGYLDLYGEAIEALHPSATHP
ncbi:MAG: glycosyltransferase family 4 protein, partial [Actinomycetota bacterium]|nr:glycosyltransferase family 4 protein [Actinomycetota bacterium]